MKRMTMKCYWLVCILILLTFSIPKSSLSNSYRPFYTEWNITESIDEITDNRLLNLMAFSSVDDQKGNSNGTLQVLFFKGYGESIYLESVDVERNIIVSLRFILGLGEEKTYVVPFKTFDSQNPILIRIDKEKAFVPRDVVGGEGVKGLSLSFLLNEENLIKLKNGKELRIQLNMNSGESLLARFKLAGFAGKLKMFSEDKKTDIKAGARDWETGAVLKAK
jgi:hypothetical protein